ncbi:MAG: DUF4150 domain-containing protein [Planctomycetota bacterium]|nr:DUF4150 domain-containing protein [Planctomycetota bacterium]
MAEHEGIRKDAQFLVMSICPDVCKSPLIPAPYPIVGYCDQSILVSPNVRSRGFPVFHMGSRVATVIGDEGGTGGGVMSQMLKGFCKPVVSTPQVRVNGQFVTYSDLTYMLMNGASPEGPFNTLGRVVFLGLMFFGDVSPGGTIPSDPNPAVSAETNAESSFLGQIQDLMGDVSLEDLVGYGQQAYALATTDWSNPGAVLGAIGGVAGMAGLTGVAQVAGASQQAYGLATADWSNPGAAIGAVMGVAGPILGGLLPRGNSSNPCMPDLTTPGGVDVPSLPPGLVCCGGFV